MLRKPSNENASSLTIYIYIFFLYGMCATANFLKSANTYVYIFFTSLRVSILHAGDCARLNLQYLLKLLSIQHANFG